MLQGEHVYWDWNQWQRVCFHTLVTKMNTEPDKYKMILSGFISPRFGKWDGHTWAALESYEQFIGVGNVTNQEGVEEEGMPKLNKKRVRVVVPADMEKYKREAALRPKRPVPALHCERCTECLAKVAQGFELPVFGSVAEAVAGRQGSL